MGARFLTPVEEHDLVVRAQAGDLAARDRAIAGIMPLIHREAIKIARRSAIPIEAEDLAQEAFLLIVKRFARFDPERGVRLSTFFGLVAKRAMLTASHENGVIHGKSGVLSKKPKTAALQLKHAGPLLSLNEPNSAAGGKSVIDMLLAEPSDETARLVLAAAVRGCVARIPKQLCKIVTWKLAGRTLEGIGLEMGLSKERVRQILAKALAQLEEILLADPVVRDYVEDRTHAPAPITVPKRRRRGAA